MLSRKRADADANLPVYADMDIGARPSTFVLALGVAATGLG